MLASVRGFRGIHSVWHCDNAGPFKVISLFFLQDFLPWMAQSDFVVLRPPTRNTPHFHPFQKSAICWFYVFFCQGSAWHHLQYWKTYNSYFYAICVTVRQNQILFVLGPFLLWRRSRVLFAVMLYFFIRLNFNKIYVRICIYSSQNANTIGQLQRKEKHPLFTYSFAKIPQTPPFWIIWINLGLKPESPAI